jgi:NAD(P)-dependent dehydrogenase (short-subunit alcohol dehydrogenase family)
VADAEQRRVAVVTGAGRGLGRAHALALAQDGAVVVVNDTGAGLDGSGLDGSGLDGLDGGGLAQQVVDEITAAGGRALASTDDVGTHAGAAALVDRALDAFGRVDAVVNNAGILRDRTFAKMSLDDFDDVVRVHLGGAAYVTHAAWDALAASGDGRVVLTSSASGLYGQFGQANYAAAKSGMVGLVNVLRQEGARSGIRVNAIAPAALSRMTQDLLPREAHPGLGPERVSPLVAHLASADCQVSGWVLEVAAGLVARVQVVESEAVVLPATGTGVAHALATLEVAPVGSPYPTSGEALARFVAAATP